jgi:imidazolonepropionase-like amidohydrolase
MRNWVFASLLCLALAACGRQPTPSPSPTAPPTPQPVPADVLVLTNGTVVLGTGAPPIPDGIVVIQQERIAAVGRAADYAVPAGTKVVDAKRGTILPGIINAHVHGTSNPAVRRVYFLLKGVTSVCDMGSRLDEMPQFEQDHVSGPAARGFRVGPVITAPGGYLDVVWHASLNYEVTGPDEAQAAVADLVNRGADAIKIALEPGSVQEPWPMLDLQEVKAIVQAAHERGKLVRAHVGRTEGTEVLDIVVESGVDVIEHVPIPVFSTWDAYNLIKDKAHFVLDSAYEARLSRLVAHQVVMVPTLDAHTLWCESVELTSEQKQACFEFYEEPVRQFRALGGMVALGNDYGADDAIEKGMPLREMRLLLAAGLTPMQVIEAGTRNAAQVCGHGKDLGTLEPGKLADIIVLNGDPLANIEAMQQVSVVIKGGQIAFTAE